MYVQRYRSFNWIWAAWIFLPVAMIYLLSEMLQQSWKQMDDREAAANVTEFVSEK